MPVYEFRCHGCGRRVALLIGMVAQPDDSVCPECGGSNLERLVSRFRMGRNEDDRIDELSTRVEAMGDPDSPAEMRGVLREMGKAMDEDYADEMEELFETDMDEGDDSAGS